jgi:hypothetical protein
MFRSPTSTAAGDVYMKAILKAAPSPLSPSSRPDARPAGLDLEVPARLAGASFDEPSGTGGSGVYFIYKVYAGKPSATGWNSAPERSRRSFYLGGANAYDLSSPSGWIGEEDIFLWDTDLSLYYNPTTAAEVAVYDSIAGLRSADAMKRIGSRPVKDAAPAGRNIARFPVSSFSADELGFRLNTNETVYRIGYYNAAMADGTGSLRVTEGFTTVNSANRNMSFWVSFQPGRLKLLQFAADGMCQALQGSDPGEELQATLSQLSFATKSRDTGWQKQTIAHMLEALTHVPRDMFAKPLGRMPDEFADWWTPGAKSGGSASANDRRDLRAGLCRSAFLLNSVQNNEWVDPAGLKLADTKTGKWELAPGAKARRFKWLLQPQAGVTLYFVPVSYLPGAGQLAAGAAL